ncbi:MAG: AraC family transcriptional regulator [Bacteroidaceae bacterium]
MKDTNLTPSLSMLYTGFKKVGPWWNFQEVISPFYRLLYVKSGNGKVIINKVVYRLHAGELFLIPKFSFHSYECELSMEQYYICFFDDSFGLGGIANPQKLHHRVHATAVDIALFLRFFELNPDSDLPSVNPKLYDNNKALYTHHKASEFTSATDIESQGILLQLFSRFITKESMAISIASTHNDKINEIVSYINKHINTRITVEQLAQKMFLSTDYFTKVFKRVLGISPNAYIQMKRVERAQTLLLTSSLSIQEVADKVGVPSLPQFSRLFTKLVNCSPLVYRTTQILNETKEK